MLSAIDLTGHSSEFPGNTDNTKVYILVYYCSQNTIIYKIKLHK